MVMRQPGAQVSSEKGQYDSARSAIAIPASAGWTGTELNPDTSSATGGAIGELFHPSQGDYLFSRHGRKILVHKIKIRGFINVPAKAAQSTADEALLVRILLVQDKQTNGATLNGEDVIQSYTNVADTLTSYQNPEHVGRFRVWKDKMFVIQSPPLANDTGATGGVIQGGMIKPFKMNLTFRKPIVINYQANAGGDTTIAGTVDNSFHILANSNSTSLGATLQYQCRCVFTQ